MRRGWSRAWRWVDGATIHATARVHPSARLAPGVVVEARARVGAGVVLGPGAVVGSSVSVGAGTSVGPHTSLQHCSIGGGCTLHAGVRIGADGFGFVPGAPAGAEQSRESQRLKRSVGSVLEGDVLPVKKPQRRRVVVGRDVEVGAGSCIDRGSWRDTSIGAHTKMDNLVQVCETAPPHWTLPSPSRSSHSDRPNTGCPVPGRPQRRHRCRLPAVR